MRLVISCMAVGPERNQRQNGSISGRLCRPVFLTDIDHVLTMYHDWRLSEKSRLGYGIRETRRMPDLRHDWKCYKVRESEGIIRSSGVLLFFRLILGAPKTTPYASYFGIVGLMRFLNSVCSQCTGGT